MAKDKFTPEEKLLKIIEGKHGSDEPIGRQIKKQKAKIGRRRFFSSLKNIQLTDLKPQKEVLTLQLINRILIIVAAVFVAVFGFDFVRDRINLKRSFALVTGVSEFKEEQGEKPSVSAANFAEVLKESRRRNIFTLTPVAKKEEIEPQIQPREKVSDLKLVGILWSSNPQAMIEDIKSGKTYLLGEGAGIKRWKIKNIYQDRVVLFGDEGESELR